MNIPLQSFEKHIDKTILQRGLLYFRDNLVDDVEEYDGVFTAIVHGSEDYSLQMTIEDGIITDHECDCPFDYGSICKHTVALMYHIRKKEEISEHSLRSRAFQVETKAIKKQKPPTAQETIDLLSHEELKSYVKELFAKDKSLARIFQTRYAYLSQPASKDLFVKQIKAVIDASWDDDGYSIEDTGAVEDIGYEILNKAKKEIDQSNFTLAFLMLSAILDEIGKALSDIHQSEGEFEQIIEEAYECLENLTEADIPNPTRQEIFEYLCHSFQNKQFDDGDYRFYALSTAISMSRAGIEATKLHKLLDTVESKGDSWDYNYRKAQVLRMQLILRTEGEEAANAFVMKNLDNSDFRKHAIQNAFVAKNYTQAIKLAEDGIKTDEAKYPGRADDWRDFLLKIYTIQGDNEQIIRITRILFLNANREKRALYDILKSKVGAANWPSYVEGLLKDLNSKEVRFATDLIPKIYIWEEYWDRLFELVKKSPSFNNLDAYASYLMKDYGPEILRFYQSTILFFVKNNMSRSHYQTACSYLNKIKKMGGQSIVNETVAELKRLYSNRPALLDELKKV